MVTGRYAQIMARYNRWQNGSLYDAAAALDEAARHAPRGAFWTSIHATLAHLCWADQIWLSRLSDVAKPPVALRESGNWLPDWDGLTAKRGELDDRIDGWAARFPAGMITGDLTWFSGAAGREITAPLSFIIAHFFNHQTHHRGQAHAMLTAAGATPEDTDLFLMPGAAAA